MDWFRKSALMWPPNPRSRLSQNGDVGAMGHLQPSLPTPVAPSAMIDCSSSSGTSHQPSAPLATGSPSGTASLQSISTEPSRKQYGLVQPVPVAPQQTLPMMTDSSSCAGTSHQPSVPLATGGLSSTASAQSISMEPVRKKYGLVQPAPVAPQQTLPTVTDSSSSAGTSHQPPAPLVTGGLSGTVSLQSTSTKLARKQYGLVMENGVTRIIPSPTSIYLAKVQSKEPNLNIPSSSSATLERAMRILKNTSTKIPQSSQKRAAHQRLRKIMLPLEEEDAGIGDGDFLHLRSGVNPIRPTTQQTTTLLHSDNGDGGIECDNASLHRGGDVLTEPNSPHCSQTVMPHPCDNLRDDNGDDAFLLSAGDIPMGPTTSHLSHTTMPHPSSNEGRGRNGDDTILLSAGDIPTGPTTPRLSQTTMPHPSSNGDGGSNGDDALLLNIGNVLTEPTTMHLWQTTMPHPSSNEGRSSNGDDSNTFHCGSTHFPQNSSGMLNRSWLPPLDEVPSIRAAAATPLPSNTEPPRVKTSTPSNTETPRAVISTTSNTEHLGASTSKPSNTEPWGPLISTSPNTEPLGVTTSAPLKETCNENQTDKKSQGYVGHMEESRKAFRETLDCLQEEYEIISELLFYTEEQWAIADAVAKKYKNQLDEVPWIRANPRKLSAPVVSLVLPSPSNTESLVATTSTASNTETLGAMISTPSNTEHLGAMTSKPSNAERWGAMISTTPNKELLGATTSTPLKEPYSENPTDPKSQGYAVQKEDGRKVFRETLDWLQEEYEIVCELLYYTKGQWAIADAVAQKYENQSAFESTGQTKDLKDEEITALRAEVEFWKDQLVTVLHHLKEKENEAQAFRSKMHKFFLSEEETEEVVAKRCWLSRYWGLALHYGNDGSKKSKLARDVMKDIKGKLNIESMLAVEKGLRELTFLKVEEAVLLEMSNHLRSGNNLIQGLISAAPSLKLLELSDDEANDVHFKRAWLIFFWARAVIHGVENDIAEDRLQYWISRRGRPTLHDAIAVGRDMLQLRELEIEQQLWKESNKEIGSNCRLSLSINF